MVTYRWRTKCFLTQVTPRRRRADSLLQCIIHRLSLSFKVAIELVHVLMEAIVGVKAIGRKGSNTIWVPIFLTLHRWNAIISPVFFLLFKIFWRTSVLFIWTLISLFLTFDYGQSGSLCFCVSSPACNGFFRVTAVATPYVKYFMMPID